MGLHMWVLHIWLWMGSRGGGERGEIGEGGGGGGVVWWGLVVFFVCKRFKKRKYRVCGAFLIVCVELIN